MNLPLRSMTVTGMLTSVVLTRTTSPSSTSSGSLGEGVEVLPEEDCDPWRPPELIVVPVCRTGRWRWLGAGAASPCDPESVVDGCGCWLELWPTRRGRVCACE